MNRNRAWFTAVAQETGYRIDILEKVMRLGELANEIGRHLRGEVDVYTYHVYIGV